MIHRKLSLQSVLFTGRDQAEASAGWPHWAVISITESDDRPAALKDGWHSVLRLQFDDIDAPEQPYVLFSPAQAGQVIDFVTSVHDSTRVEGILVHCRAGISRSAAVAKWIAERYGLPYPAGYAHYNKHVYSTLRLAVFERHFGV